MAASMNEIYVLKIGLKYMKPPIWRRIEILGTSSFFDLHVAIQDLFQWSDEHLHQFEMGKPKRDMMALWMSGGDIELDEYIGIPISSNVDLYTTLPERETRICDQFAMDDYKKKCVYTYDFGSEWKHDILLENILPVQPNIVYPRCIAGRRQAPPEYPPDNWPDDTTPAEAPFLKNSIIFRDPNVVWEDYPYKGF